MSIAVVSGFVAVLTTARAARFEPALSARVTLPGTKAEPDLFAAGIELHEQEQQRTREVAPTWTIDARPIQRVGYRHGRRHVFAVVPLGPNEVEVEVHTARAFLEMRNAAAEAGIDLRLESGFRTVAEQRALFRAWRKGRGNKAARPGRSNHQSGRALDIAVISVPGARGWLEANAATFGFKRTVKSEPWHWEYVDVPVAHATTKRVSRTLKTVSGGKRPARRPARQGDRRVATTSR